ncbi:MAG: two-component system response regulator [Candidatus Angelobacter sp. Gp1-AA117]|nr:MAG: two-component system response regulator [Candidatus Angelobacter sp. Gp1-AA117]
MKKILIVDDSPAEAKLMQAVLDRGGYACVATHDPMRIEQMIDVERPSLILMDVVMPQRNGFQACRELKEHAEYSRIPVVLVSSKNTESDKFWAKQQGADGYVTKPFTSEELLGTVQRFVG